MMSNMNLPRCKSRTLFIVLSHRQGKKLLPVPFRTLLHISGVLLYFLEVLHPLKKERPLNLKIEFIFSSPLITLYSLVIVPSLF